MLGQLAAAAAAAPLWSTSARAQQDPRLGIRDREAPELDIDYWIDAHGYPGSYSLAEQRGKWVYLYCFQDWCPGCHAHGFPALRKLSAAFPDHPGLSVVAVQTVFEGFSSNTVDDVRKLQVKYELAIPMGHDAGDPEGDHRPDTMKRYRTGGTPWTVVINPAGTVIFNDFHINIDRFMEFIETV